MNNTKHNLNQRVLDHWREICASKVSSVEETPFGPEALVYKVKGKMFALIHVNEPLTMNLKCDPQEALIIRASFKEVTAGFHMNKKHWNTVALEEGLDQSLIKDWVDDSYDLVVKGLPKKTQAQLNKL